MPQLELLYNNSTVFWFSINIIIFGVFMSMYFYLPFYLLTRVKMYFNNYLLSGSKKKGFYNFINLVSMVNKVLFNKYISKFNNINKLYIKFLLDSNDKAGMQTKNTLWFNSLLIHNLYFIGTHDNNANINNFEK